jgi:hypothetical protein
MKLIVNHAQRNENAADRGLVWRDENCDDCLAWHYAKPGEVVVEGNIVPHQIVYRINREY